MQPLISAVKYRLQLPLTWMGWSILIYILVISAVFYALIHYDLMTPGEGSLVYRMSFLMVFHFAMSMRFKDDFGLLTIFSRTRREIFQAMVITGFILSAIISFAMVLERLVIDYLNQRLGFEHIIDPFHYFAPYATDSHVLQFIFFFILSGCLAVFALMVGSLFYRFGKFFTWLFWIVFSIFLGALLPFLMFGPFWQNGVEKSQSSPAAFFANFDVLSGSGVLAVISILLMIAAYINIRRLPLK